MVNKDKKIGGKIRWEMCVLSVRVVDLYCFGVVTVEEYNVGVLRFKCIFQEFMYVCVICSYPKKKKKKEKKSVLYVICCG